jgi:hypothetical protein
MKTVFITIGLLFSFVTVAAQKAITFEQAKKIQIEQVEKKKKVFATAMKCYQKASKQAGMKACDKKRFDDEGIVNKENKELMSKFKGIKVETQN